MLSHHVLVINSNRFTGAVDVQMDVMHSVEGRTRGTISYEREEVAIASVRH